MKPLTGRLAEVSLDVRYGGLRPERELPVPTRVVWAGVNLPVDDAELTINHGALSMKIFDGGPSGPSELWRRMRVLNKPARVELKDGSVLSAKLARVARSGAMKRRDGTLYGGTELELVSWEWLPTTVAKLVFGIRPGNRVLTREGYAT